MPNALAPVILMVVVEKILLADFEIFLKAFFFDENYVKDKSSGSVVIMIHIFFWYWMLNLFCEFVTVAAYCWFSYRQSKNEDIDLDNHYNRNF